MAMEAARAVDPSQTQLLQSCGPGLGEAEHQSQLGEFLEGLLGPSVVFVGRRNSKIPAKPRVYIIQLNGTHLRGTRMPRGWPKLLLIGPDPENLKQKGRASEWRVLWGCREADAGEAGAQLVFSFYLLLVWSFCCKWTLGGFWAVSLNPIGCWDTFQ